MDNPNQLAYFVLCMCTAALVLSKSVNGRKSWLIPMLRPGNGAPLHS